MPGRFFALLTVLTFVFWFPGYLGGGFGASAEETEGGIPLVCRYICGEKQFAKNIVVLSGEMLVIEAGAHLEFSKGAGIVVEETGKLRVFGTPEMPVVFSGVRLGELSGGIKVGFWSDIRIVNAVFRSCGIKGIDKKGEERSAVLFFNLSFVHLFNVEFSGSKVDSVIDWSKCHQSVSRLSFCDTEVKNTVMRMEEVKRDWGERWLSGISLSGSISSCRPGVIPTLIDGKHELEGLDARELLSQRVVLKCAQIQGSRLRNVIVSCGTIRNSQFENCTVAFDSSYSSVYSNCKFANAVEGKDSAPAFGGSENTMLCAPEEFYDFASRHNSTIGEWFVETKGEDFEEKCSKQTRDTCSISLVREGLYHVMPTKQGDAEKSKLICRSICEKRKVNEDIVVKTGEMLVIEGGSQFLFSQGSGIQVNEGGKLCILGRPGKSVVFFGDVGEKPSGGIRANIGATVFIRNTVFRSCGMDGVDIKGRERSSILKFTASPIKLFDVEFHNSDVDCILNCDACPRAISGFLVSDAKVRCIMRLDKETKEMEEVFISGVILAGRITSRSEHDPSLLYEDELRLEGLDTSGLATEVDLVCMQVRGARVRNVNMAVNWLHNSILENCNSMFNWGRCNIFTDCEYYNELSEIEDGYNTRGEQNTIFASQEAFFERPRRRKKTGEVYADTSIGAEWFVTNADPDFSEKAKEFVPYADVCKVCENLFYVDC